jgi:sugar lactone lactonase YvrE
MAAATIRSLVSRADPRRGGPVDMFGLYIVESEFYDVEEECPMPSNQSEQRSHRTGRRWLVGVPVVVVVGGALLTVLWPSPIDAVAWRPGAPPPLAGAFAPNTDLARGRVLFPAELRNPEHVAIDSRGRVYTGTVDGTIHRIIDPTGAAPRLETFATVRGRPLGMVFAPDGDLVVAADGGGLLAIQPDGGIRRLSDRRANSVAVAGDGTVYFSEATSVPDRNFPLGMLEQRAHGSLLVLRPGRDEPETLVDGLMFANGVALTPGDESVLVVESFRYRIHRHWLSGPRAGETEPWVEDLPAIPDNLAADGDGTVWVGFNAPRSALLDVTLHPRPWLKNQVAKAAPLIRAMGSRYGLVAAFDESGTPVRSLHDPDGGYRGTSAAVPDPEAGVLWVGSLFDDGLVAVPLPR